MDENAAVPRDELEHHHVDPAAEIIVVDPRDQLPFGLSVP